MEWGAPAWLFMLPVIAAGAVLLARRARPRGLLFPRAAQLAARPGRRVRWLAAAPAALRGATLVLLVLALARPRSVQAVEEEEVLGVPIVVAIDVSSSMLAQDFQPRDRLEVAKRTVAEFVSGRPDDPIGLVAFAAEALTLVPVTTYQPILLGALERLRVGLLEDGTAIGEGLATAVNRLRRIPGEGKAIILMSDGESNRGEVDPLTAAQTAAAFGIRVYTIGVGSEGVAPVPVARGPQGFRYAERPVEIDETRLRRIAELTGGEYFRATDPQALRRIYARIDRLVESPVQTRRFARYREWYPWLLALAAAALLAEWGLRASRWGVLP
jgi:Ca-activated chloride channel family protein